MGRSPCCDKVGLKKGPWTPEEDQKLLAYIQEHGHGSWRALPPKAGLQRCGKSCRLRWTNYLRPDIKRGKFSLQEEQTIIQLHALLGNRWSAIASHLPKRTDNEIKNYWNTHLKKRLAKMGIDPVTHKPKNHALIGCGQSKDIANLSHMAQWENARLEAEARIVRESKLMTSNPNFPVNKVITTTANASTSLAPPPPRPPCLDILKVWQGALRAKPRKDNVNVPLIIGQGFSASTSLESPTSILNFTDNMLTASSAGLAVQHCLVGTSYLTNLNACAVGKNDMHDYNQEKHGEDIMDNPLQLHDSMGDPMSSTYVTVADPLRLPSFLDGFVDPPVACATSSSGQDDGGAYEDNKNSYWSNILNNVVNSPMDALGVI